MGHDQTLAHVLHSLPEFAEFKPELQAVVFSFFKFTEQILSW